MVAIRSPLEADCPAPHARGTGLSLALFLAGCAALGLIPTLPDELRVVDLRNAEARQRFVDQVVKKPKMTLAEHEEKLAGKDATDSVPAEDDSHEEKELHEEGDGSADLLALAPLAPPAAEREDGPSPVNRSALVDKKGKPSEARLADKARSLKVPGAHVDNPCVAKDGERCLRTALDPLFATFDAIARGEPDARAAAVFLGNSLIASDHVVDVVRERLAWRFGDGGRGFLLPERLSKIAGRRVRTGTGSPGWIIHTFASDDDAHRTGAPFGFSGSMHEASVDQEKTTWRIDGGRRGRLFYADSKARLTLLADGVEVARVEPARAIISGPASARDVEFRLPRGARDLTLVAQKGAQIYGVAVENESAGVVVDTIGVPAASARLYLQGIDEDLFVRQLTRRDPALVALMLGGNETRALGFGTLDDKKLAEHFDALLTRVHRAAPKAACLIVTPIDAVKTTTGSDELITRPEIHRVIEAERKAAADHGCAFFDLFGAMGGTGSLARFRSAGLLSDDLVHPTARGGDLLGHLFADALLRSYRDTPAPEDAVVFRRRSDDARPRFAGLSFPAEERAAVVVGGEDKNAPPPAPAPLRNLFARLRELEQGERNRVAFGQFGASHTAGQMLTDRMRERLGQRFGLVGRGFVSVGRPSKRLIPSGVVRNIEGPYEIADGRDVVLGGALGMSGTKARLEPGARFRIGFCQGCAQDAAPQDGLLQLAWLHTPDMGSADILVDGKPVATLGPDSRENDSDVQFLALAVSSERATLEVVAHSHPEDDKKRAPKKAHRGADAADAGVPLPVGPVNLLSVVEEMARPGIVLDAVGLPGTTGMTPQRWRQDLIGEEVKARRYDLIITAWGTNEAGMSSLDEATYRFHFGATLKTLMTASPDADCLIVGASDRFDTRQGALVQAPSHDLVEKVQRDLAAEHGCAFFSLRMAMGGPGSMKRWVHDGLGNPDHVHFTREGYKKLADILVDDLLAAYAWDSKRARTPQRVASDHADAVDAAAQAAGAAPSDTALHDAADTDDDRKGG